MSDNFGFESDAVEEVLPEDPEPESEEVSELDAFLGENSYTRTGPTPIDQLPGAFVRIQSSGGGVIDVAIDPAHVTEEGLAGYPLLSVLQMSGQPFAMNSQFFIGTAQVDPQTYVVTAGTTVMVLGPSLKGG